jgi:aryl-alcohol dehydrogenase-like predicted oxidoreductase
VVIATKGGLRTDGDHLVRDASREWLRSGAESSLQHLGTDYIDIYQLHWPDLHTPPDETGAALEELIAEGKIRHAGVSNYDAEQMQALGRFGRVETLQPPYTCSAGTSRRASCPTPPGTTSACWCTDRWRTVCSPAR